MHPAFTAGGSVLRGEYGNGLAYFTTGHELSRVTSRRAVQTQGITTRSKGQAVQIVQIVASDLPGEWSFGLLRRSKTMAREVPNPPNFCCLGKRWKWQWNSRDRD